LAPITARQSSDKDEILKQLIESDIGLQRMPRDAVLDLVRRARISTFRKGKNLFRKGDTGQSLLLVSDGFVKLSSTAPGGREVVLEIVGPGGWFGELAALSKSERNADATTITPCRIVAIDGRDVLHVMERSPDTSLAILNMVGQRLRSATQRILDIAGLPAGARLAKVLVDLHELRRSTSRGPAKAELILSQSDLGGIIGLTRESINKQLAIFRDAGWITTANRTITISDLQALKCVSLGSECDDAGKVLWRSCEPP
jgi:CRP/FNR family cyclic AMP-dependent transcriptional regulator